MMGRVCISVGRKGLPDILKENDVQRLIVFLKRTVSHLPWPSPFKALV